MNMDSNIFSIVTTRGDVEALLSDIDILIDSLYRTDEFDYDHAFKNKISAQTARFLANLSQVKDLRKQELENFQHQLQSAKFIKLTLVFEPTSAVAEKISGSVRKLFDPNLIVDFAIDRSIVGGAIIEYQGKYFDSSLAKKLQNISL